MSDTAQHPGGIVINASANSADQLLHVFFMPFFSVLLLSSNASSLITQLIEMN